MDGHSAQRIRHRSPSMAFHCSSYHKGEEERGREGEREGDGGREGEREGGREGG